MEISIKLSHAELSATNIEGTQVTEVIQGFFQTLKNNIPAPTPAFKPEINIDEVAKEVFPPIPAAKKYPSWEDTQMLKIDPIDENTFKVESKRLPMVNLNDSVKEPIGTIEEIAKFAKENFFIKPNNTKVETFSGEPEHYRTGIKIKDGIPHYKTYYKCECGDRGRHYVPKGTETVCCWNCDNDLYVDPASNEFDDNGIPLTDEYGNFYVANEVVHETTEQI